MKSISTTRLVLILGAMVSVGPLSIDMYLPSLPALQQYFQVDEARVQLTLVAFFIGLASGQLIYGPLSDRFGRKIPLLAGLAIFSLASLACALSTSIEMLILCRFLQALGGCSGMVISRAIVRDLFEPHEMARIMSLLVLVMGV
ncbi:MAG TPA: MFS transporter, partial [Pseudomonadales bacterium]|nr:MFS transporter [Pseudomonadales bacterium]